MLMQPILLSPDRISRVCPLGVRFWDEATNRAVTRGLTVRAAPKAAWEQELSRLRHNRGGLPVFPPLPAGQQAVATLNLSGIYVFRDLPGLHGVEQGAGDDSFWNQQRSSSQRGFVVSVSDDTGQFLPFTFEVQLPYRGVFNLDCDPGVALDSPISPPVSAMARAPLLSAPWRPVPGGLAVLRAELWDLAAAAPAAWAVLRLRIDDPIRGPVEARGLADERGSVLALFRYPEPNEAYPLSPPYSGSALGDQNWNVQIQVYHDRLAPQEAFVDICKALGQEKSPAATVLATVSPQVALTHATLAYGQELILKSADSPDSTLFVI